MKEEECSKDFIAPEEGGFTLPMQGRNLHTNLLYWLKENLWGKKIWNIFALSIALGTALWTAPWFQYSYKSDHDVLVCVYLNIFLDGKPAEGKIQTGNAIDWCKLLPNGDDKNILLQLSVGEGNLKNMTHHWPKWPWLSLTEVKRRRWGGGCLQSGSQGIGKGRKSKQIKRKV